MRKIKPEKINKSGEVSTPRKEIYPSFHIGLKHLPEAKDWDIGKKYGLILKLEMTGIHIDKGGGQDWSGADFDIVGIEVMPEKGKKKWVMSSSGKTKI